MNGDDIRAFRRRWGLTQRQLASILEISPGEGSVSHQMVSQMEKGDRPIPRRHRWLADLEEPSIYEALEELFDLPEDEARVWIPRMAGDAPRGPYLRNGA